MSIEIKVPSLGESVSTATVARWLKKAGDAVVADEALVELETDKVTVEVPAPSAGVLSDIVVAEGGEVSVGALLGLVEAGAAAAPLSRPVETARPAANPQAGVNPPPSANGPVSRPATPPADIAPTHAPMPAAAKIIEESGVSAAAIGGSGKDGRITKGDVLAFLAQLKAPVAAPAPPRAPPAPGAMDGPGAQRQGLQPARPAKPARAAPEPAPGRQTPRR